MIKGMKGLLPGAIILFLIAITLLSLFGKEGYPHLQTMRETLDRQNSRNEERAAYIKELKRDVYSLERDDRALEKAAREHLGMARPNEEIYFFEESQDERK